MLITLIVSSDLVESVCPDVEGPWMDHEMS